MADPLPVTPNPQQPKQDWSAILKLLPLIALAGKQGGREGIAGFLQGYQEQQQARQQQAMQQQQTAGNEQYRQAQMQNMQSEAEARSANIENERRRQRLEFLKTVQGAIGEFQTPEQFDQYAQLIGPQAHQFGIEPGAITAMRPNEAVMRQKRIAAYFKGKSDKDLELAHRTRASYTVPGVGVVPYQEWAQVAGGAVDVQGNPVLPQPQDADLTKSGLDVQAAAALKRGDTAEYNRLLQVQQQMREAGRPEMQQGGGLSPRQQQQVTNVARGFDTNQVAKNTQIIAEGASFAQSLDPNTKNAADDQALIYAFAKAMDPNSVVREGEYATVQRYAQAWAETFGFNAARIFSNNAFLTPQARQNMKATILKKFKAAQGQYNAVRNSYVKKINMITGKNDGEDWLTDYGVAFPTEQVPGGESPTQTRGNVPNPFRR